MERYTNDPVYGDELDAIVQQIVRELSGLPGQFVRPRWQPTAPWTPPYDQDWIAVAVPNTTADEGVALDHQTMIVHETVEVMVSVYGPNAAQYANRVKMSVRYPRNNEAINAHGLYYQRSTPIIKAPEMVNKRWLNRQDFRMFFRRRLQFEYDSRYIASATVALFNDAGLPPQQIEVSDE